MVGAAVTAFAVKVALMGQVGAVITLTRQRTMYGGKAVAAGDEIFVFDSETSGGSGLIARGVVVTAAVVPRCAGVARQVPLVDLTIRPLARVQRPLLRAEVRRFADWGDGRPQTEINFKFYRQATDKVVGLSDQAAGFLAGYFAG